MKRIEMNMTAGIDLTSAAIVLQEREEQKAISTVVMRFFQRDARPTASVRVLGFIETGGDCAAP